MADLASFLTGSAHGHLLLITSYFILTWGYCLTIKGWVSDDIEGMAKFSDRFFQQKDAQGNITKEEFIDYYDHDTGKKDKDGKPVIKRFKNGQFNRYLGIPGCLTRWLRILWGRRFQEISKNSKGHEVFGYVQEARKHHALNLIVQLANLILAYRFLALTFSPELALWSVLIFSSHPVSNQSTAWISGVFYAFSLLGILLAINLAISITNPWILVPSVALSIAWASFSLIPGALTFIVLFFLGHWVAGLTALIVGLAVLGQQSYAVTTYRVKAFKEQNMGDSTKIYWRKVIIMFKTYAYYIYLLIFPKRLGLFHTWGYHFEKTLEHIDWKFFLGLFGVIGIAVLAYYFPGPVRFSVIWYVIYLTVFLNFITANQFVVERYCFIPSLGFSIIIAYFLMPYPIIMTFILGIYTMRIWYHLPSYKNEVRFYESNAFNFPGSEVALGNLGVAYLNHGLPGKAVDAWLEATRINPHYDVPWYNLHNFSKQNGDLKGALDFLTKCLNSKVVHFNEQWKREHQELSNYANSSFNQFTKNLTGG